MLTINNYDAEDTSIVVDIVTLGIEAANERNTEKLFEHLCNVSNCYDYAAKDMSGQPRYVRIADRICRCLPAAILMQSISAWAEIPSDQQLMARSTAMHNGLQFWANPPDISKHDIYVAIHNATRPASMHLHTRHAPGSMPWLIAHMLVLVDLVPIAHCAHCGEDTTSYTMTIECALLISDRNQETAEMEHLFQ